MTKEELLDHYPIFKNMNAEDAEVLVKNVQEISYPKGQVLFEAGTQGEEMYIIKSGLIKISRVFEGNELTLGVTGAGGVCGEMALVDEGPRSAKASVVEDFQGLVMSRKVFYEMRKQCPSLYLCLLEIIIYFICRHLRQANQTMQVIRFWIRK